MKKILTIIFVMCLHKGFSTNISNKFSNTFINNNNELVQKLTKDKDFIKFYKLSVAGSLQKFLIDESIKNDKEASIQDKMLLNNIKEKSQKLLDNIFYHFPDFMALDIIEKNNVLNKSFEIVAALTYVEITVCTTGFVVSLAGCWTPTALEKGIFCGCMGIAFGADMVALWTTAGTAAAEVTALAGEEVKFCTIIAKNAATATCVVSSVASLVTCILTQGGD